MSATVLRVDRDGSRARVDLRDGRVVPRLVGRTDTSAQVALVAGGALLLGGDRVELEIVVGAGCLLEIEDIGGTVAYSADGRVSEWLCRIVVEEDAALIWKALPFVVADGAHVVRDTRIELAPGAAACLREVLVLGRHGEAGGVIENRARVRASGRPLLAEEVEVSGRHPAPGLWGGHRVFDSLSLFGLRAPATPSTLELEGEGSILRHLGDDTHSSTVDAHVETWRRAVLDRVAAEPPAPERPTPEDSTPEGRMLAHART